MAKISVADEKGIRIIRVKGKLVLGEGADALHETVDRSLEEGKTKIIVSLAEITHLDSSGLSELIVSKKHAVDRKAAMKIVLPKKDQPRNVLLLTMLHKVFECFDTEEEAMAAFEQKEIPEPTGAR